MCDLRVNLLTKALSICQGVFVAPTKKTLLAPPNFCNNVLDIPLLDSGASESDVLDPMTLSISSKINLCRKIIFFKVTFKRYHLQRHINKKLYNLNEKNYI